MATSENDLLRYVYYSIQVESIPSDLRLGAEINELVEMTIPKFSFESERKLVEKYSRLNREVSYDKNESAHDLFSRLSLESDLPPNPPVLTSKPSIVDEFEKRSTLIQQMMSQTGQDRDVCSFYLESVDWNYPAAIEMYGSMSAT